MKQFLTLVKLEASLKFPRMDKRKNLFMQILDIAAYIVGFAIIAAALMFAFYSIIKVCFNAGIEKEFLTFFFLILQVVILLFSLGMLTKSLYFNTNGAELLKLPVSASKIFFSKLVFVLFYICIISFVIGAPILIMFGIICKMGAIFYVLIPFICILSTVLPFGLAILLSLPLIYIVSYLKSKFVLTLAAYVSMITIGFVAYMYFLNLMLSILTAKDISAVLTPETIVSVKNFAFYFFPQNLLKNLMLGYEFWKSLIICILIIALIGILVYLFTKKIYTKLLINKIESENTFMSKQVKIKNHSHFVTLFQKDFLNIFRSVSYSFNYLAIVLTTPLMVYFSNSVASKIGAASLGTNLISGISILVLIMFISIGSSFSSTSITREGFNFYHTKLIPISFKKQIFVKVCLYAAVSIPSIIISCLVLYLFGFLTALSALLIAVAISLISVANICLGIELDITNPKFNYVGNGEYNQGNRNVTSSVGIGMVISILLGVGSIVLSYIYSQPVIYFLLFGFAVPYFIAQASILFTKVDKKYFNIEP